MPKGIRYAEEFKRDAVSQVTDRGGVVPLSVEIEQCLTPL